MSLRCVDLRCLKSQHPQERDLGTARFEGFNSCLVSKSHRSQGGISGFPYCWRNTEGSRDTLGWPNTDTGMQIDIHRRWRERERERERERKREREKERKREREKEREREREKERKRERES